MLLFPLHSGAKHVGQDVYKSRLTISRYLRPRVGPPLPAIGGCGKSLTRQAIYIFGRVHTSHKAGGNSPGLRLPGNSPWNVGGGVGRSGVSVVLTDLRDKRSNSPIA